MSKGPEKLLFTVPDHRYVNTETKYRKVKYKSHDHYYSQREIASRTHITREATFDVEVDVPAIIDLIVGRARTNKSGRAKLLDGLATAKRRGKAKELARTEQPEPLREGYEIVP